MSILAFADDPSKDSSTNTRKELRGRNRRRLRHRRRRNLLETGTSDIHRSFGEKELLVVRIQASDSSTTASEEQLYRDIFANDVTLTKQLEVCSHGQLTMKPATGNNINNGVTTIQLNKVVGRTTDDVVKEIENKSASLLGRALNQFNHVMVCMPNGIKKITLGEVKDTWHAYVPGEHRHTHFLTIYHDDWCSSVSAGMHEIGHNLGLDHSNESGHVYEDQSGQMGYSRNEPKIAKRCYNPSKSWQLGWYAKHSRRIQPFLDAPVRTILTGITKQFGNSDISRDNTNSGNVPTNISKDESRIVLLEIPNGETNIVIGYNHADGFNDGTIEGQNKVLVTEQEFGGRKKSNLLAKLNTKESYTIKNYQGSGQNLIILVDGKLSNGQEVLVHVYFQDELSNFGHYANSIGCKEHQVRFEVSVKTDSYAGDTSWRLVDNFTRRIIRSKESFMSNSSQDDMLCIDRNRDYTFTLFDEYGDGICCDHGWGAYSVFLDGEEIFHGGEFESSQVSHTFRPPAQETRPSQDFVCRDKSTRRCQWVAEDTKSRCQETWKSNSLREFCPVTCGLCGKREKETEISLTPTITRKKIGGKYGGSGKKIFCEDEEGYRWHGMEACGCDWVALDLNRRCNWPATSGTTIGDHCQATCNSCGLLLQTEKSSAQWVLKEP